MKVIVTVGTSIFDNNDIDISFIEKQSFDEWENLSDEIEEIENQLEINKLSDDCCAEVSSILKLDEVSEVYLLATDTVEGVLAGKNIKQVLQQKGFNNNIKFKLEYQKGIIKDLRVDKLDTFTKGVDNLINEILDITKGKFNDTVLNITGGYKAIIPYLTIIGQIANSKIVYIFEKSDELIELPKLPIGFDEKVIDLYVPFLLKGNLNFANNDIKEELEKWNFIRNNKNTAFGNFIRDNSNRKTELGRVMELVSSYLLRKKGYIEKKLSITYNEYGDEVKENFIGEIDLIMEKENKKYFFEVKAINSFSLKQSKKHIEKYISKQSNTKNFILLFYLIDIRLLNSRKNNFQELKKLAENYSINFEVKYIILEPQRLDDLLKKIDTLEIKNFNYN